MDQRLHLTKAYATYVSLSIVIYKYCKRLVAAHMISHSSLRITNVTVEAVADRWDARPNTRTYVSQIASKLRSRFVESFISMKVNIRSLDEACGNPSYVTNEDTRVE